MRGYEVILISAGGVCLLIAVMTLFNGWYLERQGLECEHGNVTQCVRDTDIGRGTLMVAPYTFAAGIILVGIGLVFVAHRRWYGEAGSDDDLLHDRP